MQIKWLGPRSEQIRRQERLEGSRIDTSVLTVGVTVDRVTPKLAGEVGGVCAVNDPDCTVVVGTGVGTVIEDPWVLAEGAVTADPDTLDEHATVVASTPATSGVHFGASARCGTVLPRPEGRANRDQRRRMDETSS